MGVEGDDARVDPRYRVLLRVCTGAYCLTVFCSLIRMLKDDRVKGSEQRTIFEQDFDDILDF